MDKTVAIYHPVGLVIPAALPTIVHELLAAIPSGIGLVHSVIALIWRHYRQIYASSHSPHVHVKRAKRYALQCFHYSRCFIEFVLLPVHRLCWRPLNTALTWRNYSELIKPFFMSVMFLFTCVCVLLVLLYYTINYVVYLIPINELVTWPFYALLQQKFNTWLPCNYCQGCPSTCSSLTHHSILIALYVWLLVQTKPELTLFLSIIKAIDILAVTIQMLATIALQLVPVLSLSYWIYCNTSYGLNTSV